MRLRVGNDILPPKFSHCLRACGRLDSCIPVFNTISFWKFLVREKGLLGGLATMLVFLTVGKHWLHQIEGMPSAMFFLLWLLAAILGCAFGVVRHADAVALRLGEPLGTLILTLSITGMEVSMVSAVMLSEKSNPVLARDTLFAVVMIVLGGLVGTALILGAFRHHQQEFNLEGAGAYLSLIVPLAVFALVMPDFTRTTAGPTFSTNQSGILAILCVAIYIVFLGIQTVRHREFFANPNPVEAMEALPRSSLGASALLLVACLVPVVILAEELAIVLDFGTKHLAAPHPLAGVIVAALILAPEGLSAIRAALDNQLQRSINLLLGSALATIALTVPAVLVVGILSDREVQLGLKMGDTVMLCVMLSISVLTFGRGRTNLLQGAVHLLVFLFWIALIFED
jgi:Ca2+:H+ antiporter